MLETLFCLGVGAATLKIANSIKQSRGARRAMDMSRSELKEKYSDYASRDVYKLSVFLTPQEVQVMDAVVGEFLGERTVSEKEAAAVLFEREKKK